MTDTSTVPAPKTPPEPPTCNRDHCDDGDCEPCEDAHWDLNDLDHAMATAWLEHWPVGHPERLTDWRRTHHQPWRTIAEHLEAATR